MYALRTEEWVGCKSHPEGFKPMLDFAVLNEPLWSAYWSDGYIKSNGFQRTQDGNLVGVRVLATMGSGVGVEEWDGHK